MNTAKTPRTCFLGRIGRMNAFAGEPKWANTSSFPYSPSANRSVAVFQSPSQSPFHTGSVSRDSLPLRQVRLPITLSTGISGWNSSSDSFPHWQRFPRFGAVAVSPSPNNPVDRHLWLEFVIRFISTLAAFPVIRCRCGRSVSQQPCRQASLVRIPHPVPFHTGSISRDLLPLR